MTRPPPSLPLPDLHALPGRPDTSTCDREPIHVPASIQPHGLLLVLDPDTLRVLQAAGDMQHLLGIPLDAALGEEAGRFLPSDAIQALCTPAPAPQEPGPPRLPTGARLLSGVELRPGELAEVTGDVLGHLRRQPVRGLVPVQFDPESPGARALPAVARHHPVQVRELTGQPLIPQRFRDQGRGEELRRQP